MPGQSAGCGRLPGLRRRGTCQQGLFRIGPFLARQSVYAQSIPWFSVRGIACTAEVRARAGCSIAAVVESGVPAAVASCDAAKSGSCYGCTSPAPLVIDGIEGGVGVKRAATTVFK